MRPDFTELHFDKERVIPSEGDAYVVQDAMNEQLRRFKPDVEYDEDLRRAYEVTSWEPVRLV
jgi:hypothetical protein